MLCGALLLPVEDLYGLLQVSNKLAATKFC
jgi:hypothetical protein